MVDRPIIFSAPMIRALLDGRKTQTRRLALAGRTLTIGAGGGWSERPSVWQRAQPGDRLWVRESWSHDGPDLATVRAAFEDAYGGIGYGPYYRVGEVAPETLKWRPSIHMPRWASRLTLVVTEVRRQKLQEISAKDAEAEGVFRHVAEYSLDKVFRDERGPTAIRYFRELWSTLHGPDAWAANPEVVALTFAVHRCNIDAMERAAA